MVYNQSRVVYNQTYVSVRKPADNFKRFTLKVYNLGKTENKVMKTKDEILNILKENGTAFISGEDIAKRLFVTRAAVWKGIKALEKEGHEIEAVTNRGYRLKAVQESIDAEKIVTYLAETGANTPKLFIYDEVGSTNDEALKYAKEHPGEEAVFIAGRQTAGRGRRGREFYSPKDTGLYMSFLIYPKADFSEAALYTCMTAVALSKSIKSALGIDTKIKWVNDIFLEDKKVAGILTEGIASVEDMSLSHVVIGAGTNIYDPYEGFPGKLKDIAGFLLTERQEGAREKLAAKFITELLSYVHGNHPDFVQEYRDLSMLIGKYVRVETFKENTKKKYALVTGIDDKCGLQVRYEDGHEETLSSGEVSVKKY